MDNDRDYLSGSMRLLRGKYERIRTLTRKIGGLLRKEREQVRRLGLRAQIDLLNFSILFLTVIVLYFRYLKRPLMDVPDEAVPVPFGWAVLYVFFVVIALAGLVRGIQRIRRDVYAFNSLFDRDPELLRGYPAGKRERIGISVMNWPVTSFMLTAVTGAVSIFIAYFGVKIFVYKGMKVPALGLPVLLDPWVLVIMCGIFTYFCNAFFIPPMISRLAKVGFPVPDSRSPGLIRLKLQAKLSLTFLVVIIFIGYLISTDLSALLRDLGSLEGVPPEMVRTVEQRVVVNTFLVSLYVAFLVFFTVRSVTDSLARIERSTEEIARGNLEPQITLVPVSVDRLGDLSGTIDRIRGDLSRQMGKIRDQSGRMERMVQTTREIIPLLANSIDEMMGISRKQEEQATRQLKTIQAILAENDTLSRLSDGISESVGRVVRQAGIAARKSGERGTRAIQDSRNSISTVASRVDSMEKSIRGLSELGRNVEQILNIIEGISSRGDILAMNATLQGATAGKAGTGFIRIADRMRALATEVVKEADHIRPIIQQIEIIASELLQVIEGNLKQINVGSEFASQASEAFDRIAQSISQTNETAQGISQGAQRQRELADEMAVYMRKIAEISEDGSLLSRDSTEMAERLVHVSEKLKSLALSEAPAR